MKASVFSIVLVLSTIAAASAAPFEPRPSLVVPYIKIQEPAPKELDATQRALALRGGDGVFGTPVTKNNLTTLCSLMWGLVGAVGMPAPEKGAEIFGFCLQEGSLGYLMYELFGLTAIGVAVMTYLATNKSTMSAAKIIMYGSMSCFFTTYRAVLKGSFAKTGFMDYFGVIQLAVFAACIHGIQFRSWDATLAAKVLSVFPLLMGAVGSVDPDTAGKLIRLPKQTGATNTICVWLYQALLMWGVLSWSLLSGESSDKSIGYASLVIALGIADNTFIRKVNQDLGLPDVVSYTYLALAAVAAAGLLLD